MTALRWTFLYLGCKSPTLPTFPAAASAITHYREQSDLSSAELSYLLSLRGHDLIVEAFFELERGDRPVIVDDFVAIAAVLEVTPNDLVGFVPMPPDGGPIATGLPDDLAPSEVTEWLDRRLLLDDDSRDAWWPEQEAGLEILVGPLEDQLAAAAEELHDLGELAARSSKAES